MTYQVCSCSPRGSDGGPDRDCPIHGEPPATTTTVAVGYLPQEKRRDDLQELQTQSNAAIKRLRQSGQLTKELDDVLSLLNARLRRLENMTLRELREPYSVVAR